METMKSIPSGKRKIQLLSSEVKEIMSYKPHWFVRKGNFIFLLVIVLLLALSFIISYPDTINASFRLASANAPKMLLAKSEGKLEKLFVANGVNVKKGQPVAYIQNTASFSEMTNLLHWLEKTEPLMEKPSSVVVSGDSLPAFSSLGELQGAFEEFRNTYQEMRQTTASGYYQKKMGALQKDLQFISALKKDTRKQQQLITQDQQMQESEYKVYEKLAAEKVIAPIELNQYKSKLLAKEQNLSQTASQLTNSDISSHARRKEMMELEKMQFDQQQRFRAAFFSLKSQLQEWMQRYLITATEEGTLEYVSFLQENQLIGSGQHLFYIRHDTTAYYGEMKAGQAGIGKLRPGQKVIIRMPGYPSAEFGHLEGRISYISPTPGDRDSFLIRVELPNGLTTNYKKPVNFINNLSASAEVITDNRKLINRLFGKLGEIVKR
ncbi:MAG: HlyD family efflux transporter periplasmic adaptor subunit [Chitinophagaceae bacterium]|nr:HlyD family efflux transporter periplasmic adaptor subunit [Chitinophagaceae bacterium]